jgi:hypothetical protein
MELKIVYRDNTVRLVRPTNAFFNDKPDVIKQKIEKFCLDTGEPYKIDLSKDSKMIIQVEVEYNKPPDKVIVSAKEITKGREARKLAIREHKKNLKNRTFTILMKNGKTYDLSRGRVLIKTREAA